MEVAAARAELLATKQALATGGGMDPGPLAEVLKHVDAKLLRLDASPAPSTPYQVLEQARLADAAAEAYLDKLVDKAQGIQDRISALQNDMDAAACGITKADQAHIQAKAALAAAKSALQLDATAAAPAAREDGSAQQIHTEIMQVVMQDVAKMITEELTEKTEGMDKDSFLNHVLAKIAKLMPVPTMTAAPPAAPPQAAESPPQAAPGAPLSGAPTPAGTAPPAAGGDGRLPQRTPLKTAAVEETSTAVLRKHQEGARQRKELRAADLAARREGGEADTADGLDD